LSVVYENRKLNNIYDGTHQDTGCPIGQGPISDVGVSSDPTNVSCTPVNIIRLVVKYHFESCSRVEHVATDCVKNSLQKEKLAKRKKLVSMIL